MKSKKFIVLILSLAVLLACGVSAISYAAWGGKNADSASVSGKVGQVNILGDMEVTPLAPLNYNLGSDGAVIEIQDRLYPIDYSGDGSKYWGFDLKADAIGDPAALFSVSSELKDTDGKSISDSAKLYWTHSVPKNGELPTDGVAFDNSESNIIITHGGEAATRIYVYIEAYSVAAMNANVSLTFAIANLENSTSVDLRAHDFVPLSDTFTDEYALAATVTTESYDGGHMSAFGVRVGEKMYTITPGANPLVGDNGAIIYPQQGKWAIARIWINGDWFQADIGTLDVAIPSGDPYNIYLAFRDGKLSVGVNDKYQSFVKVDFKKWDYEKRERVEYTGTDLDALFDKSSTKSIGIAAINDKAHFDKISFNKILPPDSTEDIVGATATDKFSVSACVKSTRYVLGFPGFSVRIGNNVYRIVSNIHYENDKASLQLRVVKNSDAYYYETGVVTSEIKANKPFVMKVEFNGGVDEFDSVFKVRYGSIEMSFKLENFTGFHGEDEKTELAELFDPTTEKTVGIATYEGFGEFYGIEFSVA